jgi:hypothetical protein
LLFLPQNTLPIGYFWAHISIGSPFPFQTRLRLLRKHQVTAPSLSCWRVAPGGPRSRNGISWWCESESTKSEYVFCKSQVVRMCHILGSVPACSCEALTALVLRKTALESQEWNFSWTHPWKTIHMWRAQSLLIE